MGFVYGDPVAAKQQAEEYGRQLIRSGQEAAHTATVAEVEQHLAHFMAGGLNRDQAIALITYGILVSPAHVPQLAQHPSIRLAATHAMARTIWTFGTLSPPTRMEEDHD